MVSRQQIAETPGGDQSNSLAMITNYTPGAYMVARPAAHSRRTPGLVASGRRFPSRTRILRPTSVRSSIPRISTTSKSSAVAITRSTATALTASSTWLRAPDSSATARESWPRATAATTNTKQSDQLRRSYRALCILWKPVRLSHRSRFGKRRPGTSINDQAEDSAASHRSSLIKTPYDQLRLVYFPARRPLPGAASDPGAGCRRHSPFVMFENEARRLHQLLLAAHLRTGHGDDYLSLLSLQSGSLSGQPQRHSGQPSQMIAGSNYFGGTVALAITRGRHNFRSGCPAFRSA